MEDNRRQLLGASLFAAVAFGILVTSVRTTKLADEADGTAIPRAQAKPAPDFALKDVRTGETVQLIKQARETPVVFTFWATWCQPCRMEMPHLQALSEKYRGKVTFYGINSDDTPKVAAGFADQAKYTFGMLGDTKQTVHNLYGITSLPTLFVVDKEGKVRFASNGYSEDVPKEIENTLKVLLAET